MTGLYAGVPGMIYLIAVSKKTITDELKDQYPFSAPIISTFERIELKTPVTLFVGANGSGKSTLLEGIAAAARCITVGSDDIETDETLRVQKNLSRHLKLEWSKKTSRGFFLRAEDFFGYIKRLQKAKKEYLDEIADTQERFRDKSDYARGLALGPLRGAIGSMKARYGEDLDANSHGESFLKLFQSRFVPGGLYLLDEPETPLSPEGQFAFLNLIREMVIQECQFIIATHSPIILAYPGAAIFSFDSLPPKETEYGDLSHVNLTRSFLNNPRAYLRHIFNEMA